MVPHSNGDLCVPGSLFDQSQVYVLYMGGFYHLARRVATLPTLDLCNIYMKW